MNFDRIAPWYRALEYLGMGRALERRRVEFLPDFAPTTGPRKVLILGDGDGRFLAALLTVNPLLEVDTVDASAAMLLLARRRTPSRETVRFHHADALQWLPAAEIRYDAVVTHFFLDCLDEPQISDLLVRLVPFLAPGAVWIVSEFHQPVGGFNAWRARLWIGGLYRFFGWATGLPVRCLPDHRACLQTAGFQLEKAVLADHGLLVSERWRFCV